MSQRRFDLVLKSKLVITPGIVQPPEAMGLQEDRVAELHPRSVITNLKIVVNAEVCAGCLIFALRGCI